MAAEIRYAISKKRITHFPLTKAATRRRFKLKSIKINLMYITMRHLTHLLTLVLLLPLSSYASMSFNQSDNTGWNEWISDNETVVWCGNNCVAFTNNDDIMWMTKDQVQSGGNQNLGNGDDIIGLFTAWIPNPNRQLNINGDNGDDLVYIDKNRAGYQLNNFVTNNGRISAEVTASSGNKGKVIVNNIEALCFLDGCFGSVTNMPTPAPVPLPAGIYLFISSLVGLGLIRGKNT